MDAMTVIHLSKITLLRSLVENMEVVIPRRVFEESIKDSLGRYTNALITDGLIREGKIMVLDANADRIKEIERFGITGGEAEAIAFYQDGKYDAIVSDDDVVRENRTLLNLKVIGTPSIVRWMFEEGIIGKKKAMEGLEELKKIGWFERGLLDRIIGEVEIDE
jgi:predicted nucleic acid-binding protein